MSGNDWWNRNVFSSRQNEETNGADCTSSGRVFQKMEAATGNERRPAVDRQYTAGRAAAAWTTTVDGDALAGLIPERVDSDTVAPYRLTHARRVFHTNSTNYHVYHGFTEAVFTIRSLALTAWQLQTMSLHWYKNASHRERIARPVVDFGASFW